MNAVASNDHSAGVSMSVTFRAATLADAASLAAFARRAFIDTYAADNRPEDIEAYVSTHFNIEQMSRDIAVPDQLFLLAEIDHAIAGYALLREGLPPACVNASQPIEIGRFYVDRQWKGQGLAAQLMSAVRTRARLRSANAIWLGVWERNPRAIAFYRKQGFAVQGEMTFRLGADTQRDQVMVHWLDTPSAP
jgi:ribosomal protein S18 acetylase RimI-like enzyme